MFDPRAPVRSFAFPTRSGGGSAVVAWASPADPTVRPVVFRRSGGQEHAVPDPPPPPPPAPVEAREAAPEADASSARSADLLPPPASAEVPWLDLPAASVRPNGQVELAPILGSAEDEAKKGALEDAVSALVRARADVLSDVESELLELAVDIATVLIEDELASRPALHRTLVRSALAQMEPAEGLRVRASRATYEALLEAFDSASVDTGRGRVQVELDDTVEGLGVVVQSGGATVDGRVHRRIEALRRALIDARRSRDAA